MGMGSGGSGYSQIWQHVRLAVRSWRQRPGLFGLALLTLALGMGANAAVFTGVNGVLLASLPFDDPDRAVIVWASNPPLAEKFGYPDKLPPSPAIFSEWQRDAGSFAHLALFGADPETLTDRGDPEVLGAVRTTAAFFEALGARPLLGRTFTAHDDTPGAAKVAVLSYALWQRRFGSDPAVIGQSITLDGVPTAIVGVMPRGVEFPRGSELPAPYGFKATPDLWVPFAWSVEDRNSRTNRSNPGIGRLKSGATIEQANAEVITIAGRAQKTFPASDLGWSARVEPLRDELVGDLRPSLLLLAGAAALVLLIACANVANLLLVAGAGRQREMAIRTALGAARSRLIAQLLVESFLLSLIGGVLGTLLAFWGIGVLRTVLPAPLAHLRDLALDARVLLFSGAVSMAAGLLFGTAPALLATRTNLTTQLNDASRGSSVGTRGRRTRRLLVVAEMALAVVLLIGAGLLIRSFWSLLQVDPGFRPARVVAFDLELDGRRYGGNRTTAFLDGLIERIRALPGVTSAAGIDELPMSGEENISYFTIEGRPRPAPGQQLFVGDRVVTPGYLETMGVPLRRGRMLTAQDRDGALRVAVVDESMAAAHWPGDDPVGKRIKLDPYDVDGPWITVVGVIGGVRHVGLQTAPRPTIYTAFAQRPNNTMTLIVQSANDVETLTSSVRATVRALDPNQPIMEVRTLSDIIETTMAQRRFVMVLLGAFATLALALACVGIYGVISYTVTLRTREVGVRMALGAAPRQVMRLVLREGLGLAGAGIVLGLAAAALLTSAVASMLYGVTRFDPVTFAGVPALLALVALIACYAPGRRAMRVDPMIALRAE